MFFSISHYHFLSDIGMNTTEETVVSASCMIGERLFLLLGFANNRVGVSEPV